MQTNSFVPIQRNFGFLSILGFACTVLITWEAVLLLSAQGLANGGRAGLIYGYILVWVGNISVFTALSELVSMAPTAGGQYHWVAMLAPRRYARFLSYVAGWLTVTGWQGSITSAAFLTANMCQGMYNMTHPEFQPIPWVSTVLIIAVIAWATFINTIVSSTLPKFEGAILIIHIIGFFALLIPMAVLGYHTDAKTVFTDFTDAGFWPDRGVAFFIGLVGNVFAFVGVDAAFHMAEETTNAAVTVPRSIFFSVMINGVTGLAMAIVFLFCIGDVQELLGVNPNFPHMEVFKRLAGPDHLAGACVMAALILVMAFCADVGLMASSSRVFWSFARDRGVPAWRFLSRVDDKSSVPLNAVYTTAIIAILLGLINIGSTAALNAVLSLSISGLYFSYLISAVLLLYRRCTTGFSMPSTSEMPALANTTGAELVWGPWRIPGIWGILNNIFACMYLIIVAVFCFFPAASVVDSTTMNYACVVFGGVVIICLVYYVAWARKEYNGPIIEI